MLWATSLTSLLWLSSLALLLLCVEINSNEHKLRTKKCGNPHCSARLFEGVVTRRYVSDHKDFLTYDVGANIAAFAIDISDRPDLWEGELDGKRGFFFRNQIKHDGYKTYLQNSIAGDTEVFIVQHAKPNKLIRAEKAKVTYEKLFQDFLKREAVVAAAEKKAAEDEKGRSSAKNPAAATAQPQAAGNPNAAQASAAPTAAASSTAPTTSASAAVPGTPPAAAVPVHPTPAAKPATPEPSTNQQDPRLQQQSATVPAVNQVPPSDAARGTVAGSEPVRATEGGAKASAGAEAKVVTSVPPVVKQEPNIHQQPGSAPVPDQKVKSGDAQAASNTVADVKRAEAGVDEGQAKGSPVVGEVGDKKIADVQPPTEEEKRRLDALLASAGSDVEIIEREISERLDIGQESWSEILDDIEKARSDNGEREPPPEQDLDGPDEDLEEEPLPLPGEHEEQPSDETVGTKEGEVGSAVEGSDKKAAGASIPDSADGTGITVTEAKTVEAQAGGANMVDAAKAKGVVTTGSDPVVKIVAAGDAQGGTTTTAQPNAGDAASHQALPPSQAASVSSMPSPVGVTAEADKPVASQSSTPVAYEDSAVRGSPDAKAADSINKGSSSSDGHSAGVGASPVGQQQVTTPTSIDPSIPAVSVETPTISSTPQSANTALPTSITASLNRIVTEAVTGHDTQLRDAIKPSPSLGDSVRGTGVESTVSPPAPVPISSADALKLLMDDTKDGFPNAINDPPPTWAPPVDLYGSDPPASMDPQPVTTGDLGSSSTNMGVRNEHAEAQEGNAVASNTVAGMESADVGIGKGQASATETEPAAHDASSMGNSEMPAAPVDGAPNLVNVGKSPEDVINNPAPVDVSPNIVDVSTTQIPASPTFAPANNPTAGSEDVHSPGVHGTPSATVPSPGDVEKHTEILDELGQEYCIKGECNRDPQLIHQHPRASDGDKMALGDLPPVPPTTNKLEMVKNLTIALKTYLKPVVSGLRSVLSLVRKAVPLEYRDFVTEREILLSGIAVFMFTLFLLNTLFGSNTERRYVWHLKEFAEVCEKLKLIEVENERLRKMASTNTGESEDLVKALKIERDVKAGLQQSLQQITAERDDGLKVIGFLEKDKSEIWREKESLEQRLASLQSEFNSLQAEKDNIAENIAILENDLGEIQGVLETTQEREQQLDSDLRLRISEAKSIQSEKERLQQDVVEWKSNYKEAIAAKVSATEEVDELKCILEKQEKQLEAMQNVVKVGLSGKEPSPLDPDDEASGWEVENDAVLSCEMQEKLEKFMDAAKLKVEIKALEEERDRLKGVIASEVEAKRALESHVEDISGKMEALQSNTSTAEQESLQAKMRLDILTEHFNKKEAELQKQLGMQELLVKNNEDKLGNTATELKDLKEERENYGKIIEDLRNTVEERDREFKRYKQTAEKQKHEYWQASARAERERDSLQMENNFLRRRIADSDIGGSSATAPTPQQLVTSPGTTQVADATSNNSSDAELAVLSRTSPRSFGSFAPDAPIGPPVPPEAMFEAPPMMHGPALPPMPGGFWPPSPDVGAYGLPFPVAPGRYSRNRRAKSRGRSPSRSPSPGRPRPRQKSRSGRGPSPPHSPFEYPPPGGPLYRGHRGDPVGPPRPPSYKDRRSKTGYVSPTSDSSQPPPRMAQPGVPPPGIRKPGTSANSTNRVKKDIELRSDSSLDSPPERHHERPHRHGKGKS